MLNRALGLADARLVSLCGAGGKTTLMFALAREFVTAGERVLLTTTTKIAREEAVGTWPLFPAANAEQVLEIARRLWASQAPGRAGAVIAFSELSADGDKLIGFTRELIDTLRENPYFDRILVEADGSARKPLKAPAAHEPVIPSATDALIVVAGLSGLDRPLREDNLFRPQIWARLTGIALGSPVTAESLARIVMHPDGLAKGCPERTRKILFLNQADTPERRAAAKRVVELIAAAPGCRPERAISGRLLPGPEIGDVASLLSIDGDQG